MISPVICGNVEPVPDSDYTDDVVRIQILFLKDFLVNQSFDVEDQLSLIIRI